MAKGEKASRLVFLQTLLPPSQGKETYPYYGRIQLDGKESFPWEIKSSPHHFKVWAYPEVVRQLGSRTLKMGTQNFKVTSLVTDDSSQVFDMGPIAPKIFISLKDAQRANLIQKGSTLRYQTFIKTKVPITPELIKGLVDELDDNAIRVQPLRRVRGKWELFSPISLIFWGLLLSWPFFWPAWDFFISIVPTSDQNASALPFTPLSAWIEHRFLVSIFATFFF